MKKSESGKLDQLASSLRGIIAFASVPVARCLCGNYNMGQAGTDRDKMRKNLVLNLAAMGWEVKPGGEMFRVRCPECMEKGINKIVVMKMKER